jgi:hypothetical protein
MKNKNKIIFAAGLLLAAFSLNSCLKNGKYFADFAASKASIDLPLAASNANGVVAFTFDATTTSTSIPVYVNVASPKVLSKPVKATLAIDTAFLSQYNSDNGTSYEVFPDSVYTTTGFNLTVPAGQRLDSMNVTFDFTKLNLSHQYVLPITIAQADLPIEQWNHLILYVSVKNKYDGRYVVTGSFADVTNSAFTDVYPVTVDFVTSGADNVTEFNEDYGLYGFVFNTGAGASYYGSFYPKFYFDANGNITKVVNGAGQPAANTRYATLDPTGINKFDGNQNLDVSYFMNQPSAVPASPYIRATFKEHYKYIGPR